MKSDLVIQPMQWANIADLHDTPPLDESDLACMRDVRAVLLQHGKVDRFALHLVHKHFDLADDEVLVEYNESDTREQFFRVQKATDEVLKHAIPTTWTLERMEPMVRCVCATRIGQGHLGRHESA